MRHGVPCPRPMPLQPHVLRTSRPYPEGRRRGLSGSPLPSPKRPVYRIAIPETGTSRRSSTSRTPEGASIHAGSFDPHRC
ncbi:hypothetical protein BHM03_00033405 [Ensete ventricosum]|nr:hypothetical protein BHM03_00033405 [Ensete ventricosum]